MADDIGGEYLESARFHFRLYKTLGDRALGQLGEGDFSWKANSETNSMQILVQHLHGNMLSRWTDFHTTDGEKPSRDRDGEFEQHADLGKDALMALWEEGWARLFGAVDALEAEDLLSDVTIRGQKLSVLEALNRQMTHIAYHVGQLVQIAKERRGDAWQNLSVPRGESKNIAAITKGSDRYRGSRERN